MGRPVGDFLIDDLGSGKRILQKICSLLGLKTAISEEEGGYSSLARYDKETDTIFLSKYGFGGFSLDKPVSISSFFYYSLGTVVAAFCREHYGKEDIENKTFWMHCIEVWIRVIIPMCGDQIKNWLRGGEQ